MKPGSSHSLTDPTYTHTFHLMWMQLDCSLLSLLQFHGRTGKLGLSRLKETFKIPLENFHSILFATSVDEHQLQHTENLGESC